VRGWAGSAIPAGTVAAAATFAAYALARDQDGVGGPEARTTATISLFLLALWVLAILARPAPAFRTALVAAMAAGFGIVLAVPNLREFFAVDLPQSVVVLAAVGVAALAGALLEAGWRLSGWVRHHHGADRDVRPFG
jgi:cation-transporting P-type ATPase E